MNKNNKIAPASKVLKTFSETNVTAGTRGACCFFIRIRFLKKYWIGTKSKTKMEGAYPKIPLFSLLLKHSCIRIQILQFYQKFYNSHFITKYNIICIVTCIQKHAQKTY